MRKIIKKGLRIDYWRNPEKPYPKTIYWTVIAPKNYILDPIQDHDVVFDAWDMKIRGLASL